jgi:hypothetical protein
MEEIEKTLKNQKIRKLNKTAKLERNLPRKMLRHANGPQPTLTDRAQG